jgi:predicted RNA-binding Zn ribbon-like protein
MTTKSGPWRQGHVLSGAADALCLAFVNTVAWRKAESPEDRLPSPFALLDWCVGTGLCDANYADELRRRWTERPGEALAVYRRAVTLREAIYQILRSRICSEALPDKEVRVLNRMLAAAPKRVCLAPTSSGFGWGNRAKARRHYLRRKET